MRKLTALFVASTLCVRDFIANRELISNTRRPDSGVAANHSWLIEFLIMFLCVYRVNRSQAFRWKLPVAPENATLVPSRPYDPT